MIVMWKRGLLGFAMGQKKRGKLGKREGMRKCVFHWGQCGRMDSKVEQLMSHRGEGGGDEGDRQSAVTQFSGRSGPLAQMLLFPSAVKERCCWISCPRISLSFFIFCVCSLLSNFFLRDNS